MIPGGVNSPVRAFGAVGGTPRFAVRGEGAYVVDADGDRYVDLVQSWGALLFGHARPEIVEAARAAAERGTTFGAPTEAEVELAERITAAMPSIEMVRLVSSGTEAAMSAIRLARGFTGRDLVVKFEGCYHGHSDALLAAGAGSGVATLGIPGSPGVTEGAARDTITAAVQRRRGARRCRRAPRRRDRGGHRRTRRGQHGRRAARARVPRAPPRALHRVRRAARVRRGDHRVPDRVRRRAGRVRGHAGPHDPRQGDGRRVPVRGVRRPPRRDGAARAGRPRLPGRDAVREPGRGRGRRSRRSTWPRSSTPTPPSTETATALVDGPDRALRGARRSPSR